MKKLRKSIRHNTGRPVEEENLKTLSLFRSCLMTCLVISIRVMVLGVCNFAVME